MGFAWPRRRRRAGELLPRLFTLTLAGGLFSAALSLNSRPPEFLRHHALRSPDFPLTEASGRTARSRMDSIAEKGANGCTAGFMIKSLTLQENFYL